MDDREVDNGPPLNGWYDLFSRGARDWLRHNEKIRDAVRELVDALPERERAVLVLRHYEGMTFDRIAEALEMTSRTVQNCLRRARTKLFYALRRRGITARDPG